MAYTVGLVGLIFFSCGLIGLLGFDLHYQGRIYPGVQAWGVDLSGLTPAEAAFALAPAFRYPQTPAVTLRSGDRVWTATPAELGLGFNLATTVTNAYAYGRRGRGLLDGYDQFWAWYRGVSIAPVMAYDESRALNYLNTLAVQVFVPTREASLHTEAGQVVTAPGQVGRQLDVLAMLAQIRPQLFALQTADLQLVYLETPPLVQDASAQAAVAQAMLSQPLTLVATDTLTSTVTPTWVIDQATLGAMLEIRRQADSATTAHYEVGLNPASLRAWLEPLAPQVERRQAQNARFIFNDETRQLDLLAPAAAGRYLDIEASIAFINQQLAAGGHTVPLVFQYLEPQVTETATAEQLGITELVSAQSTYFLGSGAERLNNIQLASARFHGLLVPPQATFSFSDFLGSVSLDEGYAEALIIYGGRTIRGVGGGVCQVSTTLFRTAYFGGYPIVERNSHAYRVGYYERNAPGQWSGPGLDATVFAPLVDFKFQNDTPYWLLMEVYVNPAAGHMTWKFYSTSDGRQVTVAPPEIMNVVPAPEPLYEEDAELPAGEIKQVDYAADGADVTVYRTITRNGEVVNAGERPIETHYQPWRAIFHYGPGTEGIPTPVPPATPLP